LLFVFALDGNAPLPTPPASSASAPARVRAN